MTFDRPDFAWAFLAAVPIILSFFWRPRRRIVVVPHLPMWGEEASALTRAGFSLRGLTRLLLFLGGLALTISGAAEIRCEGLTAPRRNIVAVLDDTPSMLAESRWSEALRAATAFERTYSTRHDRFVRRYLSGRKDGPRPGWIAIPPAEALRQVPEKTVLITDGCDPSLDGCPRLLVGGFLENVSLVDPYDADGKVSATIRNYSGVRTSGRLVAGAVGADVELSPETFVRWSRGVPGAGRLLVRWHRGDSFEIDDSAYLWRDELTKPDLVFVGRVNAFLRNLAAALESEGFVGPPRQVDNPNRLRFDDLPEQAVLVWAVPPEAPPESGRHILFGPAPWAKGVETQDPRVLRVWEEAGIDPPPVRIRKSVAFDPAPGARAILDSNAGALAVARRHGGASLGIFGFRLEESDMGVSPSFVILMQSVISWLVRNRLYPTAALVGASLEPGSHLEIPVTVRRVFSAGIRGVENKFGTFATDDGPGWFVIEGQGFRETVGVSLPDSSEWDLRPRLPPRDPGLPVPPWWWRLPALTILCLAGALLLLAETLVYRIGIAD